MGRKLSIEIFLERSIKTHGDKYDYSKSVYINSLTKILIICKTHGEFKQLPFDHFRGHGCPSCGGIIGRQDFLKDFISEKFKNIQQPEEYKIIPLTNGVVTVVDNEDFDLVKNIGWHVINGYAESKKIKLHRLITNCPKNKVIDHIDGNPLNNRKSNLRICSTQQNIMNRRPNKKSTSKYKGVSWSKSTNKWRVRIGLNKKQTVIGYFHSEIEAAKAYDKEAIKLFGEFAYLNFK